MPMPSPELNSYDPAMCCSTGVCGPEVDPALVRFAADLEWIEGQGVSVRRYNLGQEPDAFAREDTVRLALQREGDDALPLILLDGEVVSRGRYPTRDELEDWIELGQDDETICPPAVNELGASQPARAARPDPTDAGGCCGGNATASEPDSGCC